MAKDGKSKKGQEKGPLLYNLFMKTAVPLLGGRPWEESDTWDEETHPWMTAYCGFFALEMKRRFPELAFALEYSQDNEQGLSIADHALVHDGQRFYDARGLLRGYEPLDEDDVYTLTYLEESDLRASGILSPCPGLRDVEEEEVLTHAKSWIDQRNFTDLASIPAYLFQE